MLSSEIFTSNQLKTYTKLYEVGLFGRTNSPKNSNKKTDALIACGVGGTVKKEAFEFTKNLAHIKEIKYRKVWVEPDIMPLDPPDWMIPATFSPEMYQKILAAIIRPGVGTITNSLSVGAKIFPFYESDNLEMQFNAKKIFLAGVASKTDSIHDAWKASELFFESFEMHNFHKEKIAKINFNGAEEAALIMLNHI